MTHFCTRLNGYLTIFLTLVLGGVPAEAAHHPSVTRELREQAADTEWGRRLEGWSEADTSQREAWINQILKDFHKPTDAQVASALESERRLMGSYVFLFVKSRIGENAEEFWEKLISGRIRARHGTASLKALLRAMSSFMSKSKSERKTVPLGDREVVIAGPSHEEASLREQLILDCLKKIEALDAGGSEYLAQRLEGHTRDAAQRNAGVTRYLGDKLELLMAAPTPQTEAWLAKSGVTDLLGTDMFEEFRSVWAEDTRQSGARSRQLGEDFLLSKSDLSVMLARSHAPKSKAFRLPAVLDRHELWSYLRGSPISIRAGPETSTDAILSFCPDRHCLLLFDTSGMTGLEVGVYHFPREDYRSAVDILFRIVFASAPVESQFTVHARGFEPTRVMCRPFSTYAWEIQRPDDRTTGLARSSRELFSQVGGVLRKEDLLEHWKQNYARIEKSAWDQIDALLRLSDIEPLAYVDRTIQQRAVGWLSDRLRAGRELRKNSEREYLAFHEHAEEERYLDFLAALTEDYLASSSQHALGSREASPPYLLNRALTMDVITIDSKECRRQLMVADVALQAHRLEWQHRWDVEPRIPPLHRSAIWRRSGLLDSGPRDLTGTQLREYRSREILKRGMRPKIRR